MTDFKHVFLQNFNPSDLIFDEEETREILDFFFKTDHSLIESINIDDRLRNLAQGLLVEAVDASFAMGFVKIIFDTFYLKPPTPEISKILVKVGKKASMHWFKHAKATDLNNIRIYESVRSAIAKGFRTHFISIAEGLVMSKPTVAVIAYSTDSTPKSIWC